jgi:hypothetical protein
MEYLLEGQVVTRVCLDHSVTLLTTDGSELKLESAFSIAPPNSSPPGEVRPPNLETTAELVVRLLHQQIALVTVTTRGHLTLQFASGHVVACSPSEVFEAWTLTSSAGEQIICLPGGGLARWPPMNSK